MGFSFSQPGAEIFVPDGTPEAEALARTKSLVVTAHQDDVEFMGFPLIKEAFGTGTPTFSAVVMTNGAGSPRSGVYANCSDEDMQEIRRKEQRLAAQIGRYASVVQLRFTSKAIRDPENKAPSQELAEVIRAMKPETVMTHNFADKHNTHVGTALNVVRAIRLLPKNGRPKKLLAGEIWRGLDWVSDKEKVRLDAGGNDALAAALMGVFDSQIAGGKRYDAATFGRRRANATYGDSHAVDTLEQVAYAIDMTPLIEDDTLCPRKFILGFAERFVAEIRETIATAGGPANSQSPLTPSL